jgi:hypothetical protein
MIVQKLNFPSILQENELTYFRYIEGLITAVDVDASILFFRMGNKLRVRISPSAYENFFLILSEIKRFHTLLNIHVDFSKSMKAGSNISFMIDF